MEKLILNQYKHSVANLRRSEPTWSQFAGRNIHCFIAAASRLHTAVCPGSVSHTAPIRAVRERWEHREGGGFLSLLLEL